MAVMILPMRVPSPILYTAALQVTCFDGIMLCAYFLSEYAKMWYYNEVQAFFA